jgi:hypothetical protein
VSRVLDVIRKGKQLFVVIEIGGKQLADHDAGQAGGLRPILSRVLSVVGQ